MASDFRSWLGGKDKYAVQFVGNDGRIDPTKGGYDTMIGSFLNTSGNRSKIQNYVSGLYNQYNSEKNASADAANNQWIQAMNSQAAALRAQVAAMPKLPSFDILGNYNRAKNQAAINQRPLYDKMLNTFLEGQNVKRSTKTQETALAKEGFEKERVNLRADNETTRGRTAEDFVSAMMQLGETEQNFQTDEGRQFDVDRRALQEQTAASGLTTSGIGQQAVGDQVDQRNVMSGRQVQEFDNQRMAKQLFKDRTFEDLTRGDLRADEKAALQNKGADFDLDSYMQELAQGEKEYRLSWEQDLAGAIAEETNRLDKEGVAQFLASLAGGGKWRAQDIALAHQVYG